MSFRKGSVLDLVGWGRGAVSGVVGWKSGRDVYRVVVGWAHGRWVSAAAAAVVCMIAVGAGAMMGRAGECSDCEMHRLQRERWPGSGRAVGVPTGVGADRGRCAGGREGRGWGWGWGAICAGQKRTRRPLLQGVLLLAGRRRWKTD